MDTDKDKKDDKKVAIGKNGKKSQIILNPPEIQTPVPYKENFLRAVQNHRVAVEEKTKLVLSAKASRHDMPADVIEQVFIRGIKSLPINSSLTREQHAMNRVNSFLAGGAAMQEDYDLLPINERLFTKQLKGTGGAARPHIKREKSPYNNRTVFHVVDAKGRIKHTTDNEMEAKKHLAQKYNSYLEGVESPMKRFEGTKSLVKTYKADTPGEQKEEKMKGEDPCWKGYEMVGQKIKAGRKVPNCIPKNEEVVMEISQFKRDEIAFELRHEDEAIRRAGKSRYSSYRAPEKQEPHAVHINGNKWKTFGSQRHAQNVANKIKGATVHKEEVEIDEAKKFGYDAINARFKKQTGQSLEDRAKHYAATSERLKKMQADYEAQNKKKDNVAEAKTPAWSRKEGKNPEGGLNRKGIASYRAQNPGSKLSMAVTTEPSKLKKDSKPWKRRKSFCARMSGVDGPMKKPNGEPTRKALALRKWNC